MNLGKLSQEVGFSLREQPRNLDPDLDFVDWFGRETRLLAEKYTVGNHVIFYTYIRTERERIFVIISLILNEFSYGKAQIPHRFF